jgi:hypothetical protein
MNSIKQNSSLALMIALCFWCVMGCVAPVYETAMIKPGFSLDTGISATSYAFGGLDFACYTIGLRGDIIARYATNNRIQLSVRLGVSGGYNLYDDEILPLVDGALGLKFAFKGNKVHPAVKVELEPYYANPSITPMFLLGIAGKNQPEPLTLGLRAHLVGGFMPLGIDLLGTYHFPKGYSIFAGLDIPPLFMEDEPIVIGTLGFGYSFNSKKD